MDRTSGKLPSETSMNITMRQDGVRVGAVSSGTAPQVGRSQFDSR